MHHRLAKEFARTEAKYENPLSEEEIYNLVYEGKILTKILEDDEVSTEVIDIRSLRPLDTQTIFKSVRKTKRAIVLHEAPLFGGFGGEIVAAIAGDKETFSNLHSPVIRLGGKEIPTPFNKHLESLIVPQVEEIIQSALSLFS